MKWNIWISFLTSMMIGLTGIVGSSGAMAAMAAGEAGGIPSVQIDPKYGVPIQTQHADVTGDQRPDVVALFGTKQEQDSPYYNSLSVVVQSAGAHQVMVIPVKEGGYNPYFKLCDLSGDGVLDILVGAETGGSAGTSNYFIYTVNRGQIMSLPTPQPIAATGSYLNHYKAMIKLGEKGKEVILDLRDRKELYDQEGIYKNGKLLKPVKVLVNDFSKLEPTRSGTDTQCSLVGLQRMSGIYNADTIGYVVSLWKWNPSMNKWSSLFVTVESVQKPK